MECYIDIVKLRVLDCGDGFVHQHLLENRTPHTKLQFVALNQLPGAIER
jgi:hypothetical protein